MNKLRRWEKGWRGFSPSTFLRKNQPQIEHPIRQIIFEEAVKSGKTVLDAGCGSCIDYPRYKKHGIKYTGVDITKHFIEYAKSIYPEIDVRFGSVLALPFKNESYDAVYCKSVLVHMHPNDIENAIKELWRVARNKMMLAFERTPTNEAPLIITEPKKRFYVNRYNEEELKKIIRELNGFKNLIIKTKIGYNNMALYIVEK